MVKPEFMNTALKRTEDIVRYNLYLTLLILNFCQRKFTVSSGSSGEETCQSYSRKCKESEVSENQTGAIIERVG